MVSCLTCSYINLSIPQDDGSQISIFEYDHSSAQNKKLLPLAKNALRKLRTVRHPDVLKFLDVVETDSTIHIMTERVRPLKGAWEEMGSGKGEKEREDWFVWGLHRISVSFYPFMMKLFLMFMRR